MMSILFYWLFWYNWSTCWKIHRSSNLAKWIYQQHLHKKVKPDGYTKYQQARFIRRSEDNKFVYCLQPYTDIDNNLPYYDVIRDDYARVLGFSEAQWERISLLAYYGYQYNDNGYDHSAQNGM